MNNLSEDKIEALKNKEIISLWNLGINFEVDLEKINTISEVFLLEQLNKNLEIDYEKYKKIISTEIKWNSDFRFYANMFNAFLWDISINASYEREDWTFLNLNNLDETFTLSTLKNKVSNRLTDHQEAVDLSIQLWDQVLTNKLSFGKFICMVHKILFKNNEEMCDKSWEFRKTYMYIWWIKKCACSEEESLKYARIIFPNADAIDTVINSISENIIPNITKENVFVYAILLHHFIVQTHFFLDWNWRISRIMMVSLLEKFWYVWTRAFTFVSENYYNKSENFSSNKSRKKPEKKYDEIVAKQNSLVKWATLKIDENWYIENYPSMDKYFWVSDNWELISDFMDLFKTVWDNICLIRELFFINDLIFTIRNENRDDWYIVKKTIFWDELKKTLRKTISTHWDSVVINLSPWTLRYFKGKWIDDSSLASFIRLFSKLSKEFKIISLNIWKKAQNFLFENQMEVAKNTFLNKQEIIDWLK